MEWDILRLKQLQQEGKCCSQIFVDLGAEFNGGENPQLEAAAAALCLGVRSGLTCGALTGAAMMLSLFDTPLAVSEMIPELVEWFQKTYTECYGGIDCDSILEKNPANKMIRCSALIEDTYRKAREILEDQGFDLEFLEENLRIGE